MCLNIFLSSLLISLAYFKVVCVKSLVCDNFHDEFYRAAVYEHNRHEDDIPNDQWIASDIITTNLNVYTSVIKEAGSLGAEIILFPEGGLHPKKGQSENLKKFAKTIPEPSKSKAPINPCTSAEEFSDRPALRNISCNARESNIFVDMADIQSCEGEPGCPSDGVFIYNTAVLIDSEGDVIAKYHKFHLYIEYAHNTTPSPEFVYVDTRLGRLGMFIRFDILFHYPGKVLVEKYDVDTMLFPTHWFDELPQLSATNMQYAWSCVETGSLFHIDKA